MYKMKTTPLDIEGYTILPLSLPPLPSFPVAAIHFLYLGLHKPKYPTPAAERSLFLINVPFDATQEHIKHLFSQQIGLSSGRIEAIHFEGDAPLKGVEENTQTAGPKGKKRKRGVQKTSLEDLEATDLPSTWDRELRIIGGTAVVTFVDRASADAALKAVKAVRKEGRDLQWGQGIEDKFHALGSSRVL